MTINDHQLRFYPKVHQSLLSMVYLIRSKPFLQLHRRKKQLHRCRICCSKFSAFLWHHKLKSMNKYSYHDAFLICILHELLSIDPHLKTHLFLQINRLRNDLYSTTLKEKWTLYICHHQVPLVRQFLHHMLYLMRQFHRYRTIPYRKRLQSLFSLQLYRN